MHQIQTRITDPFSSASLTRKRCVSRDTRVRRVGSAGDKRVQNPTEDPQQIHTAGSEVVPEPPGPLLGGRGTVLQFDGCLV